MYTNVSVIVARKVKINKIIIYNKIMLFNKQIKKLDKNKLLLVYVKLVFNLKM